MAQEQTSLIIAAAAIGLTINAFFCLTLYRTLQQVKPQNRKLLPIVIWMLMIPYVSLIVNFFVVINLSASIEGELKDRGFEVTEKPGYLLGLGFAAISVMLPLPMPPVFLGILAILGIILFVQYWMKMSWYKKVLKEDLAETAN